MWSQRISDQSSETAQRLSRLTLGNLRPTTALHRLWWLLGGLMRLWTPVNGALSLIQIIWVLKLSVKGLESSKRQKRKRRGKGKSGWKGRNKNGDYFSMHLRFEGSQFDPMRRGTQRSNIVSRNVDYDPSPSNLIPMVSTSHILRRILSLCPHSFFILNMPSQMLFRVFMRTPDLEIFWIPCSHRMRPHRTGILSMNM